MQQLVGNKIEPGEDSLVKLIDVAVDGVDRLASDLVSWNYDWFLFLAIVLVGLDCECNLPFDIR